MINYEILMIIDVGTNYEERTLTKSRTADEMKIFFETKCFYHYRARKHFSTDHEFCRPVLHNILNKNDIILNPRPSRSSQKTGRIERNNGVFNLIIELMQKEEENGTPETLIEHPSLLTNLTKGSKCMNSFQMTRVYLPSVLGIPREAVSNEPVEAHIDRESVRAIEGIMKSKMLNTINTALITR